MSTGHTYDSTYTVKMGKDSSVENLLITFLKVKEMVSKTGIDNFFTVI
jgi:hypothetical protein